MSYQQQIFSNQRLILFHKIQRYSGLFYLYCVRFCSFKTQQEWFRLCELMDFLVIAEESIKLHALSESLGETSLLADHSCSYLGVRCRWRQHHLQCCPSISPPFISKQHQALSVGLGQSYVVYYTEPCLLAWGQGYVCDMEVGGSTVPLRESWVLLPNMSSVAFMGAVSLASMVSTFPMRHNILHWQCEHSAFAVLFQHSMSQL